MALVAKSYVNLKQIGEPYMVGSKMYIKVELGNGNLKQVRAYSEKEYQKYYPELAAQDHSNDPYYKTQKEVLGFKNGYITIFKGDTYSHKEWFKENGCVYRRFWGWGLSSELELPTELPEGVEAIRLNWDSVGENDSLLNDDLVKRAVENLLYDAGKSQFMGVIGERYEMPLKVTKVSNFDNIYGRSTCYVMEDANENVFVWITSSVKVVLEEGQTYLIRGTVKEHKVYKNVKQTILTRCSKATKKS